MLESITNLIATVGFPICCTIGCGWFIYKTSENDREDAKEREKVCNSQIDKFSDTLDKFNETLVKIDARLGAVETSLEETKDAVNSLSNCDK